MEEETTLERPKRDAHFFWVLFKSTFIISAFTIGGGYVIVPLLKAKYVDEYHWISDKETLDMVAIAQSMPGVIACNSAIILGYRMAGIAGTLTALIATVLPPLITLTIISYCYDFFIQSQIVKMILRGMQCGATALMVNVGLNLLMKQCKKAHPAAGHHCRHLHRQCRIRRQPHVPGPHRWHRRTVVHARCEV